MPSEHGAVLEQRLHPASMLFSFGKSLKRFALPGLLLLITGGSSFGGPDGRFGRLPANFELWLMLLLIPSALVAVFKYLTFRLRYEGDELVIQSGFLFRNVRHVPYSRIQNLDAVRNVFHRALGVADVKVETGGGAEVEATISVLPLTAFDEMRRRVFANRTPPAVLEGESAASGDAAVVAPDRTLLALPPRELLLFGFLENRGLVLIGAGYGVLWETGFLNGLWDRLFDQSWFGAGIVAEVLTTLRSGQMLSAAQVGVLLTGIAGLLLFVRLVSMGWALVRLYGFQLSRRGEDLRTDYGLFTKVSATIPLRRIQTLTVRDGPLFRLARRVSVRVATAGGAAASAEGSSGREWLAPLLRDAALPDLLRDVLPELNIAGLRWQPPHPRAFRRALKPRLAVAGGFSLGATFLLRWGALPVATVVFAWALFATRQYVRHLAWAETADVIAFRSGWLWRNTTVARMAKIQNVVLRESPFDRRAAMAGVRVDTAGVRPGAHRVSIPYLSREVAAALQQRLALQAAATEFRW